MKKFLFLLLTFFISVNCSGINNIEEPKNSVNCSGINHIEEPKNTVEKPKKLGKMIGMANPWTNCGTDFEQAEQIAGFSFALELPNYNVRAMKSMIEINYSLDQTRTVCVRKTDTEKFSNNGDISGVYTNYPVKEEMTLQNSVPIKVRGTQDKIYVMNMAISNVHYSAYCKEGMNLQEVERICNIIVQAETKKNNSQKILIS